MISQINLIPKDVSHISMVSRTVSILKMITRVLAVTLFLVVGLEYLWVFQTKNELEHIQQQITALNQTLKEQFPTEIRYLHDQKVLKLSSTVISKRKNYQDILASLYALFPPGISVDNLSFSDRVLILSVKASDVQSFATILENIKQNAGSTGTKTFGDTAMTGLRRMENGVYVVSLEMELLNPI